MARGVAGKSLAGKGIIPDTLWARFWQQPLGRAGASLLVAAILATALAPVLSSRVIHWGPDEIDRTIPGVLGQTGFAPPSAAHPLGTDQLNRDLLTRLLFAGRISLAVGFGAAFASLVLGVTIGAVAGYAGGRLDAGLMRLTDLFLAFPTLPLLLVVAGMLRQYSFADVDPALRQVVTMVVVMAALGWMGDARLVRGTVLSLRQQGFAEASRALGASSWRVISRHLLPHCAGVIIVNATLNLGSFIVLESVISYLGLGINPPTATWGNMLRDFQSYLLQSPSLALFPGTCIFLVVLGANFAGEALRDALDPHRRPGRAPLDG